MKPFVERTVPSKSKLKPEKAPKQKKEKVPKSKSAKPPIPKPCAKKPSAKSKGEKSQKKRVEKSKAKSKAEEKAVDEAKKEEAKKELNDTMARLKQRIGANQDISKSDFIQSLLKGKESTEEISKLSEATKKSLMKRNLDTCRE